MVLNESYALNNGIVVPRMAFDTWQVADEDAPAAVRCALEVGYRHIDTAIQYGNEYGVSVPQLSIRYDLQLGLLPLPRSTNPAHIRENAQLDFFISDEDMERLGEVEEIQSLG